MFHNCKDFTYSLNDKKMPNTHIANIMTMTGGMILDVSSGVIAISCAIAFFILGFLLPHGIGWSCYWVVFLLIPILISLIEAVLKRRMTKFSYPIVVVFVYCFLGMRFHDLTYTLFNVEFTGFWHPMWILFLTIPIYYMIATPIDNYVHKENISE